MSQKLVELEKYSINQSILLDDLEVVKQIIKSSKCIDIDLYGQTPLMVAVANGRENMAFYLVQAGAEINKQDYAGNTPLMLACYHENVHIVEMLLNTRKVNVQIKNKSSMTCCDIVRAKSNALLTQLISNYYYYKRIQFAKLIHIGVYAKLQPNLIETILAYI
jgi:ankyrin repeat protein